MREWITIIAAGAALVLSAATSLSGDRLKVEQRVAALEGQAAANQKSLEQIREDVRDIRQYLLGGKK